ncbi:MAG: YdeI/OmpD-associated family protein [Ardenticatenaceae bacterium]|nr:YdeI/OmpD-associated family protein [Anaerolineales bacterium]MCB8941257.1 YdeI/OmpD-associated family protein [Ardenticatenaceae bacterium]MCB8972596.1 YdeI/OmpD-associated family protein [Ardenticatenaceae bacterium]
MNPQIDDYLAVGCGRCPLGGTPECKVHRWPEVLASLRAVLLQTDLTEERKWSVPCYTFDGKNILIMAALKEYCVVGFFKGVLLKDPHGVLIQSTPNMQAERQLRFTTVQQVAELELVIKEYVQEAIEVEKAGLQVEYKKTSDYEVPDELQAMFDEDYAFREAFEALTPGRQRGYLYYFSSAKQSKTRTSRIEKCMPQIFEGIGLHDRY